MFEAAELGHRVSKEDFAREAEALRTELLGLQRRLRDASFPVVVIVSGVEGAGKEAVVNRLNEWLDTRGIATHAFWEETDEERERPRFWRFWRTLPPRGSIAILFGSWYTRPIIDRVYGELLAGGAFDAEFARIAAFERMLAEDGAVIVKFWYHLSKKEQKRRVKAAREGSGRPHSPLLARFSKRYDRFREVSEAALRAADSHVARWNVVDAADPRHRDLATARLLAEALRDGLRRDGLREGAARDGGADRAERHTNRPAIEAPDAPPAAAGPGREGTAESPSIGAAAIGAPSVDEPSIDAPFVGASSSGGSPSAPAEPVAPPATPSVLDQVDLGRALEPREYGDRLRELQARLRELAWEARRRRRFTVALFEGWDAAGKGSAIRRVTRAVDARLYRVISIAAPTDEERAHHYLWRFWRHVPRAGFMTLYDRSWYGRVLVERVERLTPPEVWRRAYAEIHEFERQLDEHGVILLKFWLHVSKGEQLRRFRERETTPWKRHKITAEDWRNRERWDDYLAAVDEMVARTSTPRAPWTLVAGEDKRCARIQVLQTFCDAMSRELR